MTSAAPAQIPSDRSGLLTQLTDEIVSGRLRPGAKLASERELAATYGISRSVVREALRTLIDQRLVESRQGRGTYVRVLQSSDSAAAISDVVRRQRPTPRSLIEARKAIECEAAHLAAVRRGESELARIARMRLGCVERTSLLDQTRFDLAFHSAIIQSAHSPVLEAIFSSIAGLTVEMMLRSLSDASVLRVALPVHEEIFQAIGVGDGQSARDAMARHLEAAEATYGRDFDRPLELIAERTLRMIPGPTLTMHDLLALAEGTMGGEG